MSKQVSTPTPLNTGDLIAWFETLSRGDVARVGGKGANLAEMTRAGLPVPPGFVVTAQAYLLALDAAGIRQQLLDQFAAVNPDDANALARTSEQAQRLLLQASLPPALEAALVQAYARLGNS